MPATSPSDTSSRSTRSRPASTRERSSRSPARRVSRSTCSLVVTRNCRRVSSSRSSSSISSRKPARENSGVRSSCDALATNSLRAVSSCASWTRMRSNAAASWPSSSSPVSAIGSSKWPSAIRLAARSSRRMRRACMAAAALPSASAIPTATNVATRNRRSTSRTVASWSASDDVSRITPAEGSSGTATSAYSPPPRRTVRGHDLAGARRLERRRALLDRVRALFERVRQPGEGRWAARARRTRPRAC